MDKITAILSARSSISGSLNVPKEIMPDEYDGDYEITPTQSTQVLITEGLMMKNNVVINPIPSNYGLIEWNGATLTVS